MQIKSQETYVSTGAGGIGSYLTFCAFQTENRVYRWKIQMRKANSSMCPVNALTI